MVTIPRFTTRRKTRLRYQKNVRGLVLQGWLFERAAELVVAIPSSILCSEDGAFAVVNAIHEFDALSGTTDAFQAFLSVLSCRCNERESVFSFGSRFEAAMCKSKNASGSTVVLPDVYFAFMMQNWILPTKSRYYPGSPESLQYRKDLDPTRRAHPCHSRLLLYQEPRSRRLQRLLKDRSSPERHHSHVVLEHWFQDRLTMRS